VVVFLPRWRTLALREVDMDKPRHPQVIRPWKIQQTKQTKYNAPPAGDPRQPHTSKLELHWKKQKTTGT
jgi:hypothetical protein